MLAEAPRSATRSGAPAYQARELCPKRTRYCIVITTWNEGARIRGQLERMRPNAHLADIVIADGDSSDGSTEEGFLRSCGVRTLLVTRERGLGTALRMGFDYALAQGYEGVVTVDGNGKDGVGAIPEFLRLLDQGYDFIQGSRFVRGGSHKNTPLGRRLAIVLLASPIIWWGGGRWYTDPTNGFKGLSRRYLTDPRVQPVRHIFERFNMQIYLNVSAEAGLSRARDSR
ncbi:MAG: glycosyltransferase family 2 protein [Bryobacterales bacterium]